ncbi:MAG: Hsp70 family protein, partial [Clostridiales bacterium]|nr:Hsp70 family protein [Clostridiales bacterium]
ITITASTNMSKEDIDKAVKDAEQYAAEDKKRREAVDVRNGADQMVYQTEKTLTDMGDKLSEEEKKDIQAGIDSLKEALKGEDLEKIKAEEEALQKKVYAVSEKLYKAAAEAQAQAQTEGGENAGAAPEGEPNVYEADFKDADEDKK